jgi:hypothetical protein
MMNTRIAVAAMVAAAVHLATGVRAETPRRIAVAARFTYYIFDGEFFGLGGAVGAGAALRYELMRDIHFENSLGILDTKGSGVDVGGLDYRLNVVAVFPVLIPYRPVARCGIGLISVDPVTVTPTKSFRPSQTTFYLTGGVGATRSLVENFLVEAEASFWITPYRYRIYEFNRFDVAVREERFMHVGISLGAVYTF